MTCMEFEIKFRKNDDNDLYGYWHTRGDFFCNDTNERRIRKNNQDRMRNISNNGWKAKYHINDDSYVDVDSYRNEYENNISGKEYLLRVWDHVDCTMSWGPGQRADRCIQARQEDRMDKSFVNDSMKKWVYGDSWVEH